MHFFGDLYKSKDAYLEQTERKKAGVYPIFNKKNSEPDTMVFKEVMFHYMVPVLLNHVDELKIVAIVRHPIEVLTSYYNAPREFNPSLDIQKEWYFAQSRNELLPERYFGYHKWKEYMKLVSVICEKYGEQVTVIKYEELSANTDHVIRSLFKQLDLAFTEQTIKFIFDSKNRTVDDPYSVFRNKDDKREKKMLPDNILNEIHLDLRTFDEAIKYGYV